jgi:hypothetical protein
MAVTLTKNDVMETTHSEWGQNKKGGPKGPPERHYNV